MRVISVLCAMVLATGWVPQNVSAGTVYAIDSENNEIVSLEMSTGLEQQRFLTPEPSSGGPDGLAVDGTLMFFINGNGSNMIYRLDPADGTVTAVSRAPELGGGSDGLAAMEDTLFSLEPSSDTITRTRISTGETLGSCVTNLGAGGGLAAENGRLFATLGLASIVELEPESCQVIGGPYQIPGPDFAYGLAYDGTQLYAGSIIRPGIHTLDPDTGDPLGFLSLDYAPTGLAATAVVAGPQCDLDVDFRPGSTTNTLNPRSRGRVPVALYGSGSMDVGDIEHDSLALSGVRAEHSAYEDVDGDGTLDLILHFRTQALVWSLESENGSLEDGMVLEVILRGEMRNGTGCRGTDEIRIRNGRSGRDHESRNRHNRRGTR